MRAFHALPIGSPPSTYAAYAAVTGEPGGWTRAGLSLLVRAGVIGTGLYVAGQREGLARSALYGAAAVEVAVLLYALNVANGAQKERAVLRGRRRA